MTIDNIQTRQAVTPEKRALTVQNEIQKDVLKEAMNGDMQKQLLQMLASAQPQAQIQQVAQNQLSKGHLDIKV